MSTVNKVIIVGRLGQDPEVRQFSNGSSITNISVATSERWTDKNTGELKEKTEWHRITLQNRGNYRLGDIAAQYLHKGSLVYIEGSLSTRKWTDQQGIERYATEIRADTMNILSSNQNNHQNQGQHGTQQPSHQGQNWQAQPQPSYQGQVQTVPQGQAPQAQYYQSINGHPTNVPVGQPMRQMAMPTATSAQVPDDDMPF